MGRVLVSGFTISLDGFGAGPDQSFEKPLGLGGNELHKWLVPTKTFQQLHFGSEEGTTGVDESFAARGFENVGAWILGRNMFGPIRGPWPDDSWKGWWGDEPPYHVPVYVLTHYERESLVMEGGTTFHFVTAGIHEALRLAQEAAGDKDVRIGGGASTIRQYLSEGLIDELHIAITSTLLGSGESLYDGVNMRALGYECVQTTPTENAVHVVIARSANPS